MGHKFIVRRLLLLAVASPTLEYGCEIWEVKAQTAAMESVVGGAEHIFGWPLARMHSESYSIWSVHLCMCSVCLPLFSPWTTFHDPTY